MDRERLAKGLRKFRLQKKMTQQQVADKVGVHYSHISHWESGRRIPHLKYLSSLSEIYGVSLDDLTGR